MNEGGLLEGDLFVNVGDAVEKQEENARHQREAASNNCHPVAPGEVGVCWVNKRRRTVVAIGKTTEHC